MPLNVDAINLTMDKWEKNLEDQVAVESYAYQFFKKNGMIKTYNGGDNIITQPIKVGRADHVVTEYEGAQVLPTPDFLVSDVVRFRQRLVAGFVGITDQEELINSGENQIIDLYETKTDMLKEGLARKWEEYLFGDGTGRGGLAPAGLEHLISETPAFGTVGGVDASNATYWRNKSVNVASITASNVRPILRALVKSVLVGAKKTDLVFWAGANVVEALYQVYDDNAIIQRNNGANVGSFDISGISSISFDGIPIIEMDLLGSLLNPNKVYLINKTTLKFMVHAQRNFSVIPSGLANGERYSFNQAIHGRFYGIAGNFIITNRRKNAVLTVGSGDHRNLTNADIQDETGDINV